MIAQFFPFRVPSFFIPCIFFLTVLPGAALLLQGLANVVEN